MKVFVVQGLVGALLQLKQNRGGLQGDEGVKQAFCQLHSPHRTEGLEGQRLPNLPIGIKHQQTDCTLQHHEAFETLPCSLSAVAMGSDVGAWLENIQKPLNGIPLLMEVEVAAEARAQESLLSQLIQEALINGPQIRTVHHSELLVLVIGSSVAAG
jgi:hypothetical protein